MRIPPLHVLAMVTAALLVASLPIHAEECPTDDSKMDAIVDFIDEHYGLAFTMISLSPEAEAMGEFEVEFWLYDERETACAGRVRVSEGCVVSDAEIECT